MYVLLFILLIDKKKIFSSWNVRFLKVCYICIYNIYKNVMIKEVCKCWLCVDIF